jgi:D-psicose/D-tagatose/L-ribulose 3-epimerase
LAIEPMNRFETFFLTTAEEGVALCELIRHPRIGLLLDTAHMVIEEKDPLAAIRRARPWLKHLQLPEADRGAPGSGRSINWEGLFRTLREIGYAGGCSLESFPYWKPELAMKTRSWRDLASSPDELARRGLAFLKEAYRNSMKASSKPQ